MDESEGPRRRATMSIQSNWLVTNWCIPLKIDLVEILKMQCNIDINNMKHLLKNDSCAYITQWHMLMCTCGWILATCYLRTFQRHLNVATYTGCHSSQNDLPTQLLFSVADYSCRTATCRKSTMCVSHCTRAQDKPITVGCRWSMTWQPQSTTRAMMHYWAA